MMVFFLFAVAAALSCASAEYVKGIDCGSLDKSQKCGCRAGTKPILDKDTCIDAAKVLLKEYQTPCGGSWDAAIGDGERSVSDPAGCFNAQSEQQPCGGLVLNKQWSANVSKPCSIGMFCQQLCVADP